MPGGSILTKYPKTKVRLTTDLKLYRTKVGTDVCFISFFLYFLVSGYVC